MRDQAAPEGDRSIHIQGVTRSYGSFKALDEVSLSILEGEFVTLLGPSGSGKTTLLMIIAGFVRPDCGSLRFGTTEVLPLPAHLRGVGMMFQSYALFPHMSVAQNIAYPLRIRKMPRQDIDRRVEDMLQLVQLQGYGERRINELSGGQRQRVALARSLVFEPRVLLMDEPLSALDKNLRAAMQLEIRRLHERLGITTVCVTHDQHEALTMSDRVVVMNRGRIEQIGTPREIYEHPRTLFVGRFVGESSTLPLQRHGAELLLFGRPLMTRSSPPAEAEACQLLIRPERLRLSGDVASANAVRASFRSSVYQGDSVLLHFHAEGSHELSLKVAASEPWLRRGHAPGEEVDLYLSPDDAVVVAAR